VADKPSEQNEPAINWRHQNQLPVWRFLRVIIRTNKSLAPATALLAFRQRQQGGGLARWYGGI
jgi:hypothetical protein